LLLGSGALAGAAAVKLIPGKPPSAGTLLPPPSTGSGTVLNDASELSPVRVSKHITFSQNPDDAFIDLMRAEIAEAQSAGRPVAVGAARHSMGGQSLPSGGTAITLDQRWMELDRAASTYRVAAGVRWSTVISQLDGHGFSPTVMQSNNDFGVASTFCVNAHGWAVPHGPFGSTVQSFRMLMADGELVECSREKNRDLFELSMGGYGLLGIIVDLVVKMVPNRVLVPTFARTSGDDLADRFEAALETQRGVAMAYGRMDVSADGFLRDALLTTYSDENDRGEPPPAGGSGLVSHVSRLIYRAQLGSEDTKKLRWWMETSVAPALRGKATRNSLINEPVATLAEQDPSRVDILHEYFVPADRFADFLVACREVIPSSYQELMNITLRYVQADPESVLCYAPTHRVAAVMSFSQEKSLRAEEDMTRMTRNLIERVAELGGAYYLPYRLHATLDQMRKVYPRLDEFVRRKLEADPGRVFRNAMWDRYMEEASAS
jgi:FAD/FMN-containing dehydrogenase